MIENEYLTMLIHRSNQRDAMRRLQRQQWRREALAGENKKRTPRLFTLRPLSWLRRRPAQPQPAFMDDASARGASSLVT
ncbi:MAG: hypothetical protein IT320_15685 [Anaerolineae bacterium]|nr:hypothetical protein [Anaerolineae bacterium]